MGAFSYFPCTLLPVFPWRKIRTAPSVNYALRLFDAAFGISRQPAFVRGLASSRLP
jgi:hypothetical protein